MVCSQELFDFRPQGKIIGALANEKPCLFFRFQLDDSVKEFLDSTSAVCAHKCADSSANTMRSGDGNTKHALYSVQRSAGMWRPNSSGTLTEVNMTPEERFN